MGFLPCTVTTYSNNNFRGGYDTTTCQQESCTFTPRNRLDTDSVKMSGHCKKVVLGDDDSTGRHDTPMTSDISNLPYDLEDDIRVIYIQSEKGCVANC